MNSRIFYIFLIFSNFFILSGFSLDDAIDEAKNVVSSTKQIINDGKEIIDEIFEGEVFEGCGENETVARDELAKNIYVKVESKYSSTEILKDENFKSDIYSHSNQSTSLSLAGIQIKNKNNKVCASISKDKLKEQTDSMISKVNSFNIYKLPKDSKEAHKKLVAIIKEVVQVINLVQALSDEYSTRVIERFQKKRQTFEKKLETIQPQSVMFNLASKDSRIYIDGNNQNYKINKKINLRTGDHQYVIKSNKHCDIKGDFKLNKYEDKIINIDVNDFSTPKITIFSDKPLHLLKLDGKRIKTGEPTYINRCEGSVSYEATYTGGIEKEMKTGSIDLKPKLEKEIELSFISHQEIQNLQKLANSFRTSGRVEVLYSYSMDLDKNRIFNTHNFNLHYLKTKKLFRYGFGFLYGEKNGTELTEAFAILGLQFTQYGSRNKPFRIGTSFTYVPFLGVKLGLGYHSYRDGDNTLIDTYPNEERDGEKDFLRDYVILKPTLGIDFLLNKEFALQVYADYSVYIENRITVGTGLSLKF
jgi:hypothetical protein